MVSFVCLKEVGRKDPVGSSDNTEVGSGLRSIPTVTPLSDLLNR